ncbi:MAG TPA: TonB-dependent receptor [Bryobacteraceae bacterium]|nr:TonB-dependent receptor [Bryobacteraceae bacterium]
MSVLVAALIFSLVGLSIGDESRASMKMPTDIPPQPLGPALQTLARERGFQVVYESAEINPLRTKGAVGELTAEEALTRLLAGTAMTYQFYDDNAVSILPPGADNAKRVKRTTSGSFRLAQETRGASTGPASVDAENDGQASQKKPAQLEEVIVTAQKREERMQMVPIAITALSADNLLAGGVDTVASLNTRVPGLQYTQQGTQASPRIRGIGTAIAGQGNENAVSTYVDNVYYASPVGSVVSFNNVQQVAVLKGPQGTLFGRNATGGLIQITTREPTQNFLGRASATYGNLDAAGADLYLSGGVMNRLAADIAVHYADQGEGFGHNLYTGRDVNLARDLSLRSKWKAMFDEVTTGTLILDYTNKTSAQPAYRVPYGESAPVVGEPAFTGGVFDIDRPGDPFSDVEQWGASFQLNHDFDAMRIASISAYRHTNWSADTGGVFFLGIHLHSFDEQYSQELQLLSTGSGPLDWVVGTYLFHYVGGYDPTDISQPHLPPFNSEIAVRSSQRTNSAALYAQGTYHFTPATSATLGIRGTVDDKEARVSTDGTFGLSSVNEAMTSRQMTWRAALQHDLSDDVMAYLSYNRGYKSGGFDPTNSSGASFEPEILDAFEVGVKGDWFGNRLRVNPAAYYYDYRDMQLNRFDGAFTQIFNGKSAKVYGLDLDVLAKPTERLALSAGVGLTHARFDDFQISQTVYVPGTGVIVPGTISADGHHLPTTPDFTANLGADYLLPLPTGSLTFHGEFFHSGRWYADPSNRLSQHPYNVTNASVTWAMDANELYKIMLWGRNLGNAAYAVQIGEQPPIDFIAIAPGRTYGVTVSSEF